MFATIQNLVLSAKAQDEANLQGLEICSVYTHHGVDGLTTFKNCPYNENWRSLCGQSKYLDLPKVESAFGSQADAERYHDAFGFFPPSVNADSVCSA